MNRREWMTASGLISALALSPAGILSEFQRLSSGSTRTETEILLVSGWQTVNIGDIAHTPGMIHILNTFFPDAHITLWPHDIHYEEEQMLRNNFPELRIVHSGFDPDGHPENSDAIRAMERADLLLHGSGPGIIGFDYLRAWRKAHNKPYGIFGVTISNVWNGLHDILNEAAFVFRASSKSHA